MHRRPFTREMALLMSTTAVTLLIATVNFFWAILWIMMALFLIKPCKVPINSNLMPPTAIQKKLLALKWASTYLLIVLLLPRVLFLTLMTQTPIQPHLR